MEKSNRITSVGFPLLRDFAHSLKQDNSCVTVERLFKLIRIENIGFVPKLHNSAFNYLFNINTGSVPGYTHRYLKPFRAQSYEFVRSEGVCRKMVSVHLHESWVACGDLIKKENNMCDILCLYDQVWSNFRYFIDLSGTRTQIMATEDEDLSASVIFLGIFRGNGRVFR